MTVGQNLSILNSMGEGPVTVEQPRNELRLTTSNVFFEGGGLEKLAKTLGADYTPHEKSFTTPMGIVTAYAEEDRNWVAEMRPIVEEPQSDFESDLIENSGTNRSHWYDKFFFRRQGVQPKREYFLPEYPDEIDDVEKEITPFSLSDRAVVIDEKNHIIRFVDPAPDPTPDPNVPNTDYPDGFLVTALEFSKQHGIMQGMYSVSSLTSDPKLIALRDAALESRVIAQERAKEKID